jgi:hypothetical protein
VCVSVNPRVVIPQLRVSANWHHHHHHHRHRPYRAAIVLVACSGIPFVLLPPADCAFEPGLIRIFLYSPVPNSHISDCKLRSTAASREQTISFSHQPHHTSLRLPPTLALPGLCLRCSFKTPGGISHYHALSTHPHLVRGFTTPHDRFSPAVCLTCRLTRKQSVASLCLHVRPGARLRKTSL